jgi:sec-independent protein translocase protein TatA
MGQSARVFKGEMKAMKDEDVPEGKTESVVTPASEASVTQTVAEPSRAADTKS